MGINEISGNAPASGPIKGKEEKDKTRNAKPTVDKAELSHEARELFEATRRSKLEEIEKRIAGGFYFDRSVAEKLAEQILAEFAQEKGKE